MPGDRSIKGFARRGLLRGELEAFLREKLDPGLSLDLFDTESSKDVFRARLGDGTLRFVKVTHEGQAVRLKKFADSLDLPFVAKVHAIIPWRDDWCVACMDWQEGRHIPLEDLNDAQLSSLADVHKRLLAAFKPSHELHAPCDYQSLFGTVASFARRHPLSRPLLHPLLSIPEADRVASPDRLRTNHGDFQYLNYLFDGNAISAGVDFDAVRRDLPVWDLAYNAMRRYYKGRLDAAKTRRLDENVRKLVAFLPYPKQDWKIAMNGLRLLFAARRLEAHPKAFVVAFIVWSRDRVLRRAMGRVLATCP